MSRNLLIQARGLRVLLFLLAALGEQVVVAAEPTMPSFENQVMEPILLRRKMQQTFTKCGFSSTVNFGDWFGVLETNSPVLFPRSDEELASIVTTAKTNGCKVRVRGAGHSEDGLVMQKVDEFDLEVIVVNLQDYLPNDPSWNQLIDPSKPSIKISAGASTLKLMSVIRPQGYLLNTNTAGRFFSLGGSYMNPSVQGASYGEGRLAAEVLSVRVMNADGAISVYDESNDIISFRGSMGLLGIVTALEIKIRVDTGLSMNSDTFGTSSARSDELRNYFADKLTNNDGTEFFYWVQRDEIVSFEYDNDGNPSFDPASTQGWYDQQLARQPDLAFTGGESNILGALVQLFSGLITMSPGLAAIVRTIGQDESENFFEAESEQPNDGHFVDSSGLLPFEEIFYSIKCASDCVDEMTQVFIASRDFLITARDDDSSSWYPTLPLEWRVFDVTPNEMLLEHLDVGTYIGIENIALLVPNDAEYSKFHKQLEDMWRSMFPGGGVHHGKAYGYEAVPGVGFSGEEFPFQDDAILDSIYSESVRASFIAKMIEYDPSGTFAAGSVLRLLGLTSKEFSPLQYNGDSCETYGNGECFSGCCQFQLFGDDFCVESGKPRYALCNKDCECAVNRGNACRWGFFSFVNKCRD